MDKVQLHDCCGAQHIFRFESAPSYVTNRSLYLRNSWASVQIPMTALQYLRLLLEVDKSYVYDGVDYFVRNVRNPGITTCVLNHLQNRKWGEALQGLGFQLVVNNVRNRNSSNQLFFYVRIESPIGGAPRWTTPDGIPCNKPRMKVDGNWGRVRHPVTGLLIQPVQPPTRDVPLLIAS